MKKFMIRLLAIVVLPLILMSHAIWMESTYKGVAGDVVKVNLFFGEFEKDLREKGKALDGLNLFKAFYLYQNSDPVPIELQASDSAYRGQFVARKEGFYQILAINDERPVQDWTKHGLTVLRPIEFQRSSFTAFGGKKGNKIDVKPFFYLDIIPDYSVDHNGEMCGVFKVNSSIKAKVFLKRKKMDDLEISVYTPDKKILKLTTDLNGEITLVAGVSGTYLLTAALNDGTPGKFLGKDYKFIRYHISTTLNVE